MNGLVTEGIPLGVPFQILTSGLSGGGVVIPPLPPGTGSGSGGSVYLGLSRAFTTDRQVIKEDGTIEFHSAVVALPASMISLSAQVIEQSIPTTSVQLSNDGITFTEAFSFSGPGIKTVRTTAKLGRAIVAGETPVTLIVLTKRKSL